jgi:hypothetical protein
MAELPRFFWDFAGHAHTNALHWEDFPHLLWESLQVFGYTEPPPYDGVVKSPPIKEDLKVSNYQSQEADNTFITSDGTSPYNSAR